MKIRSFGGIDNVSAASAVADNRFSEMSGVEITNSGAAIRAAGCRVFSAGTGRHSIHSDGSSLYFREGTGLYRLDGTTATLLDNNFTTTGGRTIYYTHFDRTYYSDATHTGVLQSGEARSWGLTPPPLPRVANAIGDLIPGRYHVAATYIRDDGQESGARGLSFVDSTGGLTITVTSSSDSSVVNIGVYVTSSGGDVPYLQAVIPNANWTGRVSGNVGFGRPLDTNLCTAPPACSCMAEYRGRLYLGSGSTLWFTRSGNQYELVGPLDRSFYPLGEQITNVMAVDDGLWVTTTNSSMFLLGGDPHEGTGLTLKFKQAIGGVAYSGRQVDSDSVTTRVPMQGKLAIWTSAGGVCIGGPGGYFKNITGDYFQPPGAEHGMSFARSYRNMDQYIFGLLVSEMSFNMTLPAVTMSYTAP